MIDLLFLPFAVAYRACALFVSHLVEGVYSDQWEEQLFRALADGSLAARDIPTLLPSIHGSALERLLHRLVQDRELTFFYTQDGSLWFAILRGG